MENKVHTGIVAQVMGPVVDVRFGEDYLPSIYNALTLPIGEKTLTVKTAGKTMLPHQAAVKMDCFKMSEQALQKSGLTVFR